MHGLPQLRPLSPTDFYYITEWVPGSHITMSKNPDYWNADAIKLGGVEFVLMERFQPQLILHYQSGDVLFIEYSAYQEIPTLTG